MAKRWFVLAAVCLLFPYSLNALHSISTITVNGSRSAVDSGQAVALDANGNIYIAGYIDETSGATNIYLAKYNSSLVVQASVTVKGSGNNFDAAYAVAVAADGSVYAAGCLHELNRNIWIAKYNSTLNLQTAKTINGQANGYDCAQGLALDSSGNVYISGYAGALSGGDDMYVAKLNSSLVLQASATYNGSADGEDHAQGITVDGSGNVYVVGYSSETSGGQNIWIGKYNSSLVLQSSTSVNGYSSTGDYGDAGYQIGVDGSSVYAAGAINRSNGTSDVWIGKFNSSLVFQASATFNGSGDSADYGLALGHDANGNLYAAGSTNEGSGRQEEIWIAKFHSTFVFQSSRSISGYSQDGSDYGWGLAADLSGNVFVTGSMRENTGFDNIWIGKFFNQSSAPENFSGSVLGTSSITWTWSDVTDKDGFRVVTSTGGALSGNLDPWALSWTETGLSPNTAHARSVAAFYTNGASTSSAVTKYTLAAVPSLTGFIVSSTSIQAVINPGSNPNGTALSISSDSFSASGSAVGSSAGNPTSVTLSNLTPNRDYSLDIGAYDGSSLASTQSLSGFEISTRTLAQAPSVSGFQVFATSITVLLNPQANPIGTGLSISSSSFALAGSSVGISAGNPTALTLFNLTPNTTYALDLGAFNASSLASTQSLTGFEISTRTAAAAPALAGFQVFTTSVTVTLTRNGNPLGTPVAVSTGSSGNFSVSLTSAGILETNSTILTIFNMPANATYSLQAGAWDETPGASTQTLTLTASTFTPVAAPSVSSYQVFPTSITVAISPLPNTIGTKISLSSASFAAAGSSVAISTGNPTLVTLLNLLPNRPYNLDIGAFYDGPNASTQSLMGFEISTRTRASPPALGGFQVFTTSITITLLNNGNPLGTPIGVSTGSAGHFKVKSFVSGIMGGSATSLTIVDLATNTAFSLQAATWDEDPAGSTQALTLAATLYTLAAPPTGFIVTTIYESSASLSWGANSNSSTTIYVVQYWTSGSSVSSTTVTLTSAVISGLLHATSYYLDVKALNGDLAPSASASVISTMTLPTQPRTSTIALEETTLQLLPNSGTILVKVPQSAFSESVNLTIQLPSSLPGPASQATDLQGTGVAMEIFATPSVQPLKNVEITMNYRSADVAGLDESRLIVARYDSTQGVWVPLPSTPNAAAHKITALTNHFSLFQLMQATPAKTLAAGKVFPNPFRPALGHNFMFFTGLPVNTSLKIYTMSGELIRSLETDAAGIASWDGFNDSGRQAASGVYLVLIQSGADKKIIKVAIQR